MKLNIIEEKKNPSVAVITPTIGKKSLAKAMESVARQTFKNLHHYIITDGSEYFKDTMKNASSSHDVSNFSFHVTPNNTGKNGFYGHRIYAAYPHLLDEDYIVFLDEDNWFEPNHIQSLVDIIQKENYDWAYSLRKVYVHGLRGAAFLADDCCESIGRWPIYFTQSLPDDSKDYLVDTSSYCFKREFIIQVCNHWHSGWGGDRRFFRIIHKQIGHDNFGTTGLHTLHYELPDMYKAYGGDFKFFEKGNKEVKEFYNGIYPWEKNK